MKFSLVSKESHISFNPLEKCQDTMLKKQANSISIKLYFYTCWDSDDEDFWDYEVFYTCVPLKPGDINSATWAYWIISSISYYPLWLRLYSLQKYVLVLTISLDRWMMDYRWKWYSKYIPLKMNMNIILGYFPRFPHFKIGWFRQTKNHNTVIICAFYRWNRLKCLAGSISKKVFSK